MAGQPSGNPFGDVLRSLGWDGGSAANFTSYPRPVSGSMLNPALGRTPTITKDFNFGSINGNSIFSGVPQGNGLTVPDFDFSRFSGAGSSAPIPENGTGSIEDISDIPATSPSVAASSPSAPVRRAAPGANSIDYVADLMGPSGSIMPQPRIDPLAQIGSTNMDELFDIEAFLGGNASSDSAGCESGKCDSLLSSDDVPTVRTRGRVFNVSWVPKEGSRWEHRCVDSDKCIAINGKQTPILHLQRGNTYRFDIDQDRNEDGSYDNALYFTEDLLGGEAGLGTDDGIYEPPKIAGTPDAQSTGSMYLKIDDSFPSIFFYQGKNCRCQGCLCIVHSQM